MQVTIDKEDLAPHPSSLVSDPGPTRCIDSGVRRLEGAQAPSSNSRITPHPSLRAAGGVALALFAAASLAQSYPSRPIRVIVPNTAGSATDIAARIVAQRLAESMGQQTVIDNRAGATGQIAMEIAAKAVPDGYTLIVAV